VGASVGDGAPPTVEALLTGAQALGERLGTGTGRLMGAVAALLRPRSAPEGPACLDAGLIDELEPLVCLRVPLDELEGVAGLERWLAHHVIEPLPGAGDARVTFSPRS
jgi:hypothetical protein